jgi:hypothetical protein
MSTRYTARPISKSVWEIVSNRKKVGFVRTTPTGWVARIGEHCETATTTKQAVERVVAKALGHASPEALAQQNAIVRAQNAESRRQQRAAFNAAHTGDFDQVLNLLSRMR